MDKDFKDLFYEKLLLSNMSYKEQSDFLLRMSNYLSHGRTLQYVSDKLDKLLEFLYALDFKTEDVVHILTIYPAMLNIVDNLYEKYILLGVIENSDNTMRITKMLYNPKDLMISLDKMYARYRLIKDSGYCNFTWNNIVHASDKEFSRLFIPGSYGKPYQMFESELEVLDYLSNVDIRDFDLSAFKDLPVNEEIVRKYEKKGRER